MINTNKYGFIQPVGRIDITLDEIIQFSDSIKSETRASLTSNLIALIEELDTHTTHPCQIWIYGSYASLKCNPNDIDIKVFLHPEDRTNLNDFIAEVYKHMDSMSLHVDFRNFNLINLSKDDEISMNTLKTMALNQRFKGKVLEKASGYFHLNL